MTLSDDKLEEILESPEGWFTANEKSMAAELIARRAKDRTREDYLDAFYGRID